MENDPLARLEALKRAYSPPLQGTASSANSIRRVNYTHDAMIDFLIANPTATHKDITAAFGYTQSWISRVINSDAFQARLAVRKGDIVDPTLVLTVEEKLRALTDMSLEVVMDKLALTKDANLAVKALELSTKALGYGARPQNVTMQQSFVVAMPTKVPDSGEWAAKHSGLGAGTGAMALPEPAEDAVVVEETVTAIPSPVPSEP